jgi:hypothetical protein
MPSRSGAQRSKVQEFPYQHVVRAGLVEFQQIAMCDRDLMESTVELSQILYPL